MALPLAPTVCTSSSERLIHTRYRVKISSVQRILHDRLKIM